MSFLGSLKLRTLVEIVVNRMWDIRIHYFQFRLLHLLLKNRTAAKLEEDNQQEGDNRLKEKKQRK